MIEKLENASQRSITLQMLRGLAIIVVLIHHSISRTGGWVILHGIDDILICFHMPVFFIIAGYLYQNKISKYENMGKGRFLLAKAKHLLVPYVFWTVLLWCGVQVANSISTSVSQRMISIGFGPMSIKNLIVGLLTYEEYYTEHLWFLYVLFLYFLVHTLLGKTGSTKWCLIIGMICGFLCGYVQFPNIIERFLIWFVFFAFGRFIANRKGLGKDERKKKTGMTAYVLVIFAILSCVRLVLENVDLGINIYILVPLRQAIKYALGFWGVYLLYLLAAFIERKLSKIARIIKNIGDYSYDIYLMHNPYIVALGCTVFSSILGLNPLLTIIVATVAGVIIPMLISKFVIRRFNSLSKIMIGR